MGYSHILDIEATLPSFREAYNIPEDVDITYYHEGDIALQRHPHVAFFPLMAILEGRVRFPVDSLILNTLRFYGLCPDQLPPNFYQVVSCISRLNQIYGLQLDHHDINFMYNICGNIRKDYYLKVRDVWVRLISCLPDSNRNSTKEYVWVSGNWLAGELTCPTSPRDIGLYHTYLTVTLVFFSSSFLAGTNTNPFRLCLFWLQITSGNAFP